MSGTLNKVMLIGHLGDDVKMHYFDGGGCVGRFSLATNEVYTNKTSGDKVYIEGRIKTRKWQDQENKDRYTTEINVDEFTFLSTKKNEGGGSRPEAAPPAKEEAPPESDLPF